MRRGTLCLVALLLLILSPRIAPGEEVRPPARLLLNLPNVPWDSPETAFRESLKVAPRPRPTLGWEILPDGSARYGTAGFSVVVSPPCEVGAPRPLALPGPIAR